MSDMNQNPYAASAVQPKAVRSEIEEMRHKYLTHEASVKSIGILFILGGIMGLLAGVVYIASGIGFLSTLDAPGELPSGTMAVMFLCLGIVAIALSVGQLIVAFAIRKLTPWSRIAGAVFAAIGLLGFPIGTMISAYMLYLLLGEKGVVVFSPQYKKVIDQTPHIKYKTSIIVWIGLALIVGILLFGIVGIALSV